MLLELIDFLSSWRERADMLGEVGSGIGLSRSRVRVRVHIISAEIAMLLTRVVKEMLAVFKSRSWSECYAEPRISWTHGESLTKLPVSDGHAEGIKLMIMTLNERHKKSRNPTT